MVETVLADRDARDAALTARQRLAPIILHVVPLLGDHLA